MITRLTRRDECLFVLLLSTVISSCGVISADADADHAFVQIRKEIPASSSTTTTTSFSHRTTTPVSWPSRGGRGGRATGAGVIVYSRTRVYLRISRARTAVRTNQGPREREKEKRERKGEGKRREKGRERKKELYGKYTDPMLSGPRVVKLQGARRRAGHPA